MSVSIIAENTKRIMKERGLKQKDVAKWAGISEKQFSALMTGRKIVRDTDVIAIANALSVSPNELFCRDKSA